MLTELGTGVLRHAYTHHNSEKLESTIDNLDTSTERYSAKLVIADNIIHLHRAEFSGRETTSDMGEYLTLLSKMELKKLNFDFAVEPYEEYVKRSLLKHQSSRAFAKSDAQIHRFSQDMN